MRTSSIRGKLVQLREAHPSTWLAFIFGWLTRRQTGQVPCLIPGVSKPVRVPVKDFYESYFFFCEQEMGRREIEFFIRRLRHREVFYDIGAFRGVYSFAVKAHLTNQVSIHTFEPVPGNFAATQAISQLNVFEGVTLNQVAIGEGDFVCGTFNEGDAMLRLGEAGATGNDRKFESITLDEYVARGNPPPTIMKIDVDGFELQVLKGARACLAQHHPRLWMEVHPAFLKQQGKNADEVLRYLQELNYKISFFEDYRVELDAAYHVWCEDQGQSNTTGF